MNALIKICIKLNIFGFLVLVVSAIAVYGFNQGSQKFLGMHVLNILQIATYGLLAVAALENLIFKPAAESRAAKLTKQFISLKTKEDFTAGEIAYMNDVIDESTKIISNSHRVPVVLGFFLYFAIIPVIGSPIAEWAALAILWFGPLVLGMLFNKSTASTRALNPELYATTMSLRKTMGDTLFNKA